MLRVCAQQHGERCCSSELGRPDGGSYSTDQLGTEECRSGTKVPRGVHASRDLGEYAGVRALRLRLGVGQAWGALVLV